MHLIVKHLEKQIKEELFNNAPKVETSICDKGHIFPNDMSLRLSDIPGLSNDVVMCPICFNINMANASRIPADGEIQGI